MTKEQDFKEEFLGKIEKIRTQISSSTDYLALQRCMEKIQKIKIKISNLQYDQTQAKQIQSLICKCEDLIKEKTKYFKKKITKKLQQQNQKYCKPKTNKTKGQNLIEGHYTQSFQHDFNKNQYNSKNQKKDKEKTLKLSKSVDNFDRIKEGYTFRKENNEKNLDNSFQDDRTQIKYNKINKRQFDKNYESQLNFSRGNQKSCLTMECNKTQIYPYHSNQLILEQYHYKMRQKTIQIEQIKSKLKYYEQTNQQLKNKILNEQRRHDDYINSLKTHISKLDDEIQKLKQQKKQFQQSIKLKSNKIQFQQIQIVKLADKLQKLLKQKQKQKLQQSRQTQDLRKQLETLSKQEEHIRNLDYQLQLIKTQNQITLQKFSKLQFQYKSLKQDFAQCTVKKQQLQELIQLKLEQNDQLKAQLRKNKVDYSEMHAQVQSLKDIISNYQSKNEDDEKKRERNMKRKLQKLKQVRTLLLQ